MKSKKKQLLDITEEQLLIWCDKYTSASDILREEFNMSINGNYTSIIISKMKELDIEFLVKYKPPRKYKRQIKNCPVCDKEFEIKLGNQKEKTTCSNSCANTYFRSGKNHPNYNKDNYRNICFENHNKECIICGENNIVEVHHFDENHNNDDPYNLIPLCPTHPKYMHSRYKYLIDKFVIRYRNKSRY